MATEQQMTEMIEAAKTEMATRMTIEMQRQFKEADDKHLQQVNDMKNEISKLQATAAAAMAAVASQAQVPTGGGTGGSDRKEKSLAERASFHARETKIDKYKSDAHTPYGPWRSGVMSHLGTLYYDLDVESLLKFAEGRKDSQITQGDLEDWNGYGIPVLRTEDGKDVKGFEMIFDFARVLHGHLLTMTEGGGEANTIVGNTADKNGLEAWRRLGARFYPISEAGATGLAIEIKSISKAQSAIEVPGKFEILDKLCA